MRRTGLAFAADGGVWKTVGDPGDDTVSCMGRVFVRTRGVVAGEAVEFWLERGPRWSVRKREAQKVLARIGAGA